MENIDLSIVIVNYNTCQMTIDCIKSVIKHTKNLNYEIIVIDNNSKDKSVHEIRKIENVKLIENRKNYGYSKANNQGIKTSKGKAVLILNSDTKIIDNAIFKAWKKLDKTDILTIRLQGKDGKNQQAGGYGPNLFNLVCWAFFFDDLPGIEKIIKPYQISNRKFFEKDHELDWVMGAFLMVKKQVFEKIGLLDEHIFMYGEEMDFCKRAKDEGFKISYFSKPTIIHYGCGSSESGVKAIIGEYQALKYFFHKYSSKITQFFIIIILKLSSLIRLIIFSLLGSPKGNFYAKAYHQI